MRITQQSNQVQVLMHLNGGYTRLLVSDLPGYCRPEPVWEIPTAIIPASLRRIGSRFIVEIDLIHPEPQDSTEGLREAVANACRVRPLNEPQEQVA